MSTNVTATLTMIKKDLGDNYYGRSKSLGVSVCICDYCQKEKPCLFTDSSEKEYIPVNLCRECTNFLFQRYDEKGEFLMGD